MYGDLCVLLSWLRELFPILNYTNISNSNNNFDSYNRIHNSPLPTQMIPSCDNKA